MPGAEENDIVKFLFGENVELGLVVDWEFGGLRIWRSYCVNCNSE